MVYIELLTELFKIPSALLCDLLFLCVLCVKFLDNYSRFIDKIREYQKEYQWKYKEKKEILDKSFKSAIKYCIKNNILKDFLKKHSSEVLNMLYGEYDPEVEMKVVREEEREYFLELLKRDLTKEEIIQRLQQKEPYAEYDPEVEMRVVREEALEEGMEKEKLIIAKNLLEKGSSPEFVREITGLSLDKIEELL